MLMQGALPLLYCILRGGLPLHQKTQISTQALIECWFASMTVRQKMVVSLASVEQTMVHIPKNVGMCLPGFMWVVCMQHLVAAAA